MTEETLDLVPAQDLMDALSRRYDICIFAGAKYVRSGADTSRWIFFRGEYLSCKGLALDVIHLLNKHQDSLTRAATGDET